MKQTTARLALAACILSCVYLTACQKDDMDPMVLSEAKGGNGKGNHGNGNGNGGANGGTASGTIGGTASATVSTRTCYYGQGYWFGSGKRTWPDLNGGSAGVITIGNFHYTQQQAWDIWKSSNSGGKKDVKKAFVLLATLQLSGTNVATYTNMSADVTTVTNWLNAHGQLSASNMSSAKMPANVKAAYNRLKDWMETHDCDDDEDEVCTTDIAYWFGPNAHTWTTSTVTVAGATYSATDLSTAWNTYSTTSVHDPQNALLLLVALRLSGSTTTGYTGMAADIATIEAWLMAMGRFTATNNPTTAMPAAVASAYNRLKDWVEDNDCDDD